MSHFTRCDECQKEVELPPLQVMRFTTCPPTLDFCSVRCLLLRMAREGEPTMPTEIPPLGGDVELGHPISGGPFVRRPHGLRGLPKPPSGGK